MAAQRGAEAQGLFDVIAEHARKHGSVVAAVDAIRRRSSSGDQRSEGPSSELPRELTYKDLHDSAQRIAGPLEEAFLVEGSGNREDGMGDVVVTQMNRGNEWYVVYAAAMLLRMPIVGLSMDLTDKATERRRNREILERFRPRFVIVDGSRRTLEDVEASSDDAAAAAANVTTTVISFAELWHLGGSKTARCLQINSQDHALTTPLLAADAARRRPRGGFAQGVQNCEVLCYNYTGGTTKASKCVIVTHSMALSEVRSYPQICHLRPTDRVLQQHSVYWSASCYGEVDIALAFGCALVFSEAKSPDEVAEAIREHEVSCAGLVPVILSGLEPATVPSLKLIFTWGEKLNDKTAKVWTNKERRILDLLISTECWLSLYADWGEWVQSGCGGNGRPAFKKVRECAAYLASVENAPEGAGELVLAGPMVFPGYLDATANGASRSPGPNGCTLTPLLAGPDAVASAADRLYHTKDLVAVVCEGSNVGLRYVGRHDDLIKVGGEWMDATELQLRALRQSGLEAFRAEAAVIGNRMYVAIPMGTSMSAISGCVGKLRHILPPDFGVYFLVGQLPRTPTGKVDRKALELFSKTSEETLPVGLEADEEHAEEEVRTYLRWYWDFGSKLLLRWVLPLQALVVIIVHLTICTWNRLAEALQDRIAMPAIERGSSLRDELMGAFFGNHMVVFDFPVRLLVLTYIWYATIHLVPEDSEAKTIQARLYKNYWSLTNYIPWRDCGLFAALVTLLPLQWTLCLALPGIYLAWRRGRLFSWPVAALFMWGNLATNCRRWRFANSYYTSKKWIYQKLNRCRECSYVKCKKACMPEEGRVHPEDSSWYCLECHKLYDTHRQCALCKAWAQHGRRVLRGGTPADAPWVCTKCAENQERAARGSPGTARTNAAVATSTAAAPADSSSAAPNWPEERERCGPGLTHSWFWQREFWRHEYTVVPTFILPQALLSLVQAAASSSSAAPRSDDRVWRLIEETTGWQLDSEEARVTGMDSLRVTKLRAAVRRELARIVDRTALLRCSTMGALVRCIKEAPEDEMQSQVERRKRAEAEKRPGAAEPETCHWYMMWTSPVKWQIHRSRPIEEQCFRAALLKLMERHPALRMARKDPSHLYKGFQQINSLLLCLRKAGYCRGPWQAWLLKKAVACIKRAWPRVQAQAPPATLAEVPLQVLPAVPSLEKAKEARTGYFYPPFGAVLIPIEPSGEQESEAAGIGNKQAFVQIAVSHMFSDGFSYVALVSDLAHLLEVAEAEKNQSELPPPLPPLVNMPQVAQERLFRTVEGDNSRGDVISFDDLQEGYCASSRESRCNDAFTYVVPREVRAALRHVAHEVYAQSEDILVLTILATTFARLQVQEQVTLQMVVPQRDAHGEQDLIGLLSDSRELAVHIAPALSYLGVASAIAEAVKNRRWYLPPIGWNWRSEACFVNFQWTDWSMRKSFQQVGGTSMPNIRNWDRTPVSVTVDELNQNVLRFTVNFDKSEFHLHNVVHELTMSLQRVLQSPAVSVWAPSSLTPSESPA
eukprot:TRINITY_DN57970_c0_g1_i1.p1 TRINITY_DN57970_c0_g1~~TRINITY_DN57970_c0_g1_i1.p1  ORF type:complete len:1517 (+),score=342.69 TRINITY_DN57970_c0_g1_i1:172-4722(+)